MANEQRNKHVLKKPETSFKELKWYLAQIKAGVLAHISIRYKVNTNFIIKSKQRCFKTPAVLAAYLLYSLLVIVLVGFAQ